jgi:hypothetical protein
MFQLICHVNYLIRVFINESKRNRPSSVFAAKLHAVFLIPKMVLQCLWICGVCWHAGYLLLMILSSSPSRVGWSRQLWWWMHWWCYQLCLCFSRKQGQVRNLIDSTNPDIIFGTETWIDSNIKDSHIFPSVYNIFRKDRNCGGGGVLIAVKDIFTFVRLFFFSSGVDACIGLMLFDGVGLAREVSDRTL